MRRSRLHKAGDHSLCRRCAVLRDGTDQPRLLAPVPPLPAPAPALVLDPAAEMRALASRLVLAHEEEPSNTWLARELRMTLAELMPKASGKPDADLTGLFSALQA